MIIRRKLERICKSTFHLFSSSQNKWNLAEEVERNKSYLRKQGVIGAGMRVRIKKRYMRDLWVMKMEGMGMGIGMDQFKKDLAYRRILDKDTDKGMDMDKGTDRNLSLQSTHTQ
jgi:hypothetical protein